MFCDSTLRVYRLNITDEPQTFKLIIDYLFGRTISINQNNVNFLYNLSCILQMYDLMGTCIENMEKSITETSLYNRFKTNCTLYESVPEIKYIIKHFSRVKILPVFRSMNLDILEEIMRGLGENEYDMNELFLWIYPFVQKNPKLIPLYSHIDFSKLSAPSAYAAKTSFDITTINGSLWGNICRRLNSSVDTNPFSYE